MNHEEGKEEDQEQEVWAQSRREDEKKEKRKKKRRLNILFIPNPSYSPRLLCVSVQNSYSFSSSQYLCATMY